MHAVTTLVLAVALTTTVSQEAGDGRPASFGGHQVLKVFLANNSTVDLLRGYEGRPGVDFWTDLSDQVPSVDVMVSPDVRRDLTDQLTSSGARYAVNIDDVQSAIAAENPSLSSQQLRQLTERQGHPLTWTAYHRLVDHHAYLDFVARTYPDCDTFSIGSSSESRDLKGIKCGTGAREIWMDGGIHAREWISPAVVSYIVQALAEYSNKYRDILGAFTVYIIPVLNPDGYEHTHTDFRLWRKTRSQNPGSSCIGTDPNRNFDVHWGEVGTSTDPCSGVYQGSRAFSEPETNAVKEFLLSHASKMEMYLSFHSYSQLVLTPYGYSKDARPDDYCQLERVAKRGAERILQTYGRKFRVGQPSRILYSVAGSSADWAKEVAGIKYSYTFELRDQGRYGFLLPANQIVNSGKEMIAGVMTMIRAIL